jgi:hypothetical protein
MLFSCFHVLRDNRKIKQCKGRVDRDLFKDTLLHTRSFLQVGVAVLTLYKAHSTPPWGCRAPKDRPPEANDKEVLRNFNRGSSNTHQTPHYKPTDLVFCVLTLVLEYVSRKHPKSAVITSHWDLGQYTNWALDVIQRICHLLIYPEFNPRSVTKKIRLWMTLNFCVRSFHLVLQRRA